MHGLRTDIQVLRALAVLSVLVFHFDLPGLDKGFLGVDVFFVISGYLMSGVIMREMDEGRFRPSRFYLRRARRLLPAAFAMMAATTAIAPFVLTPSLLADYARQLAGALTFSANVMLWLQSGYFDGRAELKPLLHTWSLSLEEQYYLVLPLCLAWIAARWRAAMLTLLLAASAAACLWWQQREPSGTFYLLHTRAWELLLGSLCALPAFRDRGRRLPFDAGWLCLPLLLFALVWGVDPVHPRLDTLLACLATAGLIVMPSAWLNSTKPWMQPLLWIGDRSYSLYLVHWPLIAFARSVWLEGVPGQVHAVLLALSFVLAHASYTWIEQPMRQAASARELGWRLGRLALPLLAASAWMWVQMQPERSRHEGVDWRQALRPNHGFARRCDQVGDYRPRPECASAAKPRTLVWGDSYAMHLIPGLIASPPRGGIAQATRSACAPLLDMARRMPHEPLSQARRCLSFNQSVLQHLARSPHIEQVVLSARWQYFFIDPVFDASGRQRRPDPAQVARSLADTVGRLRAMGKKVLIVSPPPSIGPEVNLGLCAERRALALWTVTPSTDAQCGFSQRLHEARNSDVIEMLGHAARLSGTEVLRLDAFMCTAGHCAATLGAVPLYRDAGHLSHEGSQALGRRMDLGPLVSARMR